MPVASWRDKWSPQPEECLLINLKLESPSASTTHQVNICARGHLLTHTCTFVFQFLQMTATTYFEPFNCSCNPSELYTCCISSMCDYTCEILATKTDQPQCSCAHMHPIALTASILLHFSCDRCSLYFCRTTAYKKHTATHTHAWGSAVHLQIAYMHLSCD